VAFRFDRRAGRDQECWEGNLCEKPTRSLKIGVADLNIESPADRRPDVWVCWIVEEFVAGDGLNFTPS
jgi:hypothetical protein